MTAAISTDSMTDSTAPTANAPGARPTNSRLSVVTTERRHVPKPSGKPDPTAHLTAADVEALAANSTRCARTSWPRAAPATPHTSAG